MQLPDHFFTGRKLETLVENHTSYTLPQAEIHVYETHQQAERILLTFDQPVLASMIQGKKIMHMRGHPSFDFLPGESLILPAKEPMCIDFPEADENNPTQCLAISIAEEKIAHTLGIMNEVMPKADKREWTLMDYTYRFTNDAAIYKLLQRLLFLFAENHSLKDFFVDNMIKELIIRILQTNNRETYSDQAHALSSTHRLAYVLQYIRENLHLSLSIEELSQKACMSTSNFHRVFKNELGISPVDFINHERIKRAASLLQDSDRSIKEVYQECGFESRSYFNRVFKRLKQVSPGEYQTRLQSS